MTRRNLFTHAVLLSALSIPFTACGDPKADDGENMDDDDDDGDDDDGGDDDDAGDDDDDGGTGTGTGEDPNACVPGIMDCEDDFKCQPYVKEDGACCVDADSCVPIMGDKQFGEACTRTRYNDDCGKDLFCFAGTSGKEGAGKCKQLCDGTSPDSCEAKGMPEATCIPFNDGKLPLCEVECHPLRPACEDGDGCYWGGSQYLCSTPDPEAGKGKDGDDCYTVQSCNPGLACVAAANLEGCESMYCCTTFCDLEDTDGAACTGAEACVAFHDPEDAETDPQWLDIGICALPEDE